jgi:hypothetical protein
METPKTDPASDPSPEKQVENAPEDSVESPVQAHIAPLDKMMFAQLLTAAQQSGIVANHDVIAAVRDNDVRFGRYQKAFDLIEQLYMQMNSEAMRRQGELLREEVRYKSGALKMTPKEWLLRQRRETEKTQRIEAARRQFLRVLDGLNAMRAAHSEL